MNPIAAMRERTREKLLSSFSAFARRAWREIEPKALQWNWHHDLICEYLQLAYERDELRLIFCMPPRELKSRLVSVLFPAWCWARDPGLSFILTSYSDSLSEELSVLRRNLLQSPWFQETFPNQVRFLADQNRREQYGNQRGGMMIATSTAGTLTGKGADFLIVDDLLSPQQSYSDLERINANRFFDSTLRSRLNEPVRGGIVVVCQRLHEADLPGHLLESEPGVWTIVNMPMIAEADESIVFPISGRVVERKTGDLLHPARFPKTWCEKQQLTLGRLVWSAQYQQRPSPLEGNLIKVSDVLFYGGKDPHSATRDPDLPLEFERKIISVDCTFKDKSTSDYVCILVIGIVGARRYVLHIVNSRLSLDATENEIRAAHSNYGPIAATLVEDKANGSAVISHLRDEIPGVIAVNPEGGKISRMMAAAPEFEANNWFFDRTGAWTNRAIDQLCLFPNAKNDDIVDSISQAAVWLQKNRHELGLLEYLKKLASGAKSLAVRRFVSDTKQGATFEEPICAITEDQWRAWIDKNRAPKCSACGNECTALIPGLGGTVAIFCRQCGAVDGREPRKELGSCCAHFLPQRIGGVGIRCGNCGTQNGEPVPNGVSRGHYGKRRFTSSFR